MTELTKVFSRMAGHDVRCEQTPWTSSKEVGTEMAAMFRWFEDVGFHADIPSLRHEYRNLTSFESWVHANWQRQMTA